MTNELAHEDQQASVEQTETAREGRAPADKTTKAFHLTFAEKLDLSRLLNELMRRQGRQLPDFEEKDEFEVLIETLMAPRFERMMAAIAGENLRDRTRSQGDA